MKTFLKETTTRKFTLTDKSQCEELTKLFHPSQLEERFGGEAPECKQFWPPYFPDSEEYNNDPENQIEDDEEYLKILEERPNLVPLPEFEEEAYRRRNKEEIKFEEIKEQLKKVQI